MKADQTDIKDDQEAQEVQEQHKLKGIDFTKPWDHSDITFIVEDQKVYANKMILAMSSPVIKTMFESDFKEKNDSEIKLPEKKLSTFFALMQAVHPPYKMKGMLKCVGQLKNAIGWFTYMLNIEMA